MQKRGLVAAAVTMLTCAVTAQPASAAPFIVGGTAAEQAYSFVVSLQDSAGQHFCGGSLVTPSWLVTAAHCVQGKNPSLMTARIASNDHTQGGEMAQPAEIVVHMAYRSDGAGGDIALVRLSAPARAAPIALGQATVPGTMTRLLGWGQTCPTEGCGQASDTLQQLDTQLVEPGECTAMFDRMVELCTDNPGGKAGSCYGDSGSPQVTKADERWRLLGVTSRPGNGDATCATAPSVYTSAVAYSAWITEQTGKV